MTNFFFERYRPEICRGLHKWCCERILRRFRCFRAKKKFSKVASFFTFFAYPGSEISYKMTNFFFERFRPEICRELHKWCCERILRRFRSFRGKKKFSKVASFLTFSISGVTDFLKNDQLPFSEIPAWNLSLPAQMVLRTNFKAFSVVSSEKNFFRRFPVFFSFFAYPSSQISWKMTNYFLERYRPEICRGLHKWCCERILRRFRSFRAKKFFFEDWQFFDIFCISGGHGFSEKSSMKLI